MNDFVVDYQKLHTPSALVRRRTETTDCSRNDEERRKQLEHLMQRQPFVLFGSRFRRLEQEDSIRESSDGYRLEHRM